MSFPSDVFAQKFTPVQLGRYQLLNITDYINHMKSPCTVQDPFKWGGFLEILAASIMYRRPVNVHVMDLKPEFQICYDVSFKGNAPIRLSYEGGDHYNAIVPVNHCFVPSRPGLMEMTTLSAIFIQRVRMLKLIIPRIVSSEELNIILENKVKFLKIT